MLKQLLIAAVCTATGCANLPDGSVGYYQAHTRVGFRVVRTVACDGNDNLVIANAVTPSIIHLADRQHRHEIKLSALKGTFSDSDVKLEFYEDGRLKSFNGSSTGEGEPILKTVISLAPAVFGFVGGTAPTAAQCAEIKKAGGDKPLTLTYGADVDFDQADGLPQNIEADAASGRYAERFAPIVGTVCAVVVSRTTPQAPTSYAHKAGDTLLTLHQPALVQLKVMAGGNDNCRGGTIWEGEVAVAQLGTDYELPIPPPVLFGKEVLAASVAESGALTSVQFTSNTGAGQALNIGNSVLTRASGESTAQKAADVKAESDLIAEQQRLVQCLANPQGCK